MEKLVLGVFWLLTLLKQPLLPFTFSVRNSDKRISCDEEFSDSEDEGEGGRKNVANFKKAKRVKTEEEKEEEEKKGKIGSPPSCMELCLVCAFLPFYHVFFFLSFSFPEEKEEEKAKEEKPEPKGWAPCLLAWQLTGCLCTSLCIPPMGYCVTCGVGREMWQLGWLCHGEKFA